MADANHTPGPWLEGERNAAGMSIYAHFPDERFGRITGSICCVWSHLYLPPQETNANAALILAAPDLFAALQSCVGFVEAYGQPETRLLVRAALAKALGR